MEDVLWRQRQRLERRIYKTKENFPSGSGINNPPCNAGNTGRSLVLAKAARSHQMLEDPGRILPRPFRALPC